MNIRNHFEHWLERKHLNIFWTLYLNVRYFSFKQAIRLPIKCYGKIRVRCASGRIVLPEGRATDGVILIGVDPTGYRTCCTTTLTMLEGATWEVTGNVKIYQGASILVGKQAHLTMRSRVTIGDNAEVICMEKIDIGEHTDITWDCQVTDFASHQVRDTENGVLHPMSKPVIIGAYCWIGNRTTVMPGTVLPERIIVASNSLLNKDYKEKGISSYSLIGGIPASLIKSNIERIY